MQDLKKAMPDLAHGLQQLLEYPGDVESDIPTTFSIEEDNFGEVVTHELKPGGYNITVTNSTRQEYVRLYTQWVLEDSIDKQFAAFKQGFRQVLLTPPTRLLTRDSLGKLSHCCSCVDRALSVCILVAPPMVTDTECNSCMLQRYDTVTVQNSRFCYVGLWRLGLEPFQV